MKLKFSLFYINIILQSQFVINSVNNVKIFALNLNNFFSKHIKVSSMEYKPNCDEEQLRKINLYTNSNHLAESLFLVVPFFHF